MRKLEWKEIPALAVRFSVKEGVIEIAHGYLYFITNDGHDEPYALLEDVFVDPKYQGKGIGKKFVRKIMEVAQQRKCYKVIAYSRISNKRAHTLYEKLGLKKFGFEFRLDFTEKL